MVRRSNAEWLAALQGGDPEVLADLRTYVLRAALFTLQRMRPHLGHLGTSAVAQLAEDCAQEAMAAILERLHTFRGESHFTTWAYTFGVNIVTFEVEGVYDYYCLPHEEAGMVGRIVVGRPSGPGALPFDYFKGRPGTAGWKPVPEAARKTFPPIERIMQHKVVRREPRT